MDYQMSTARLLAVKRKEGRLIRATLFEPFKSQKYNNNNNI